MQVSVNGKSWTLLPPKIGHVEKLMRELSLSRFVATCIAHHLPSDALLNLEDWASPNLEQLHDPFLMKGMPSAIERIERAIQDNERIRIVTDYDVDGTTSSLILQAVCGILAGRELLDYHIPNRFIEGYGFSIQAAEQAAKDKINLIITADIGIRDAAAVTRARQLGVDVVICDHHLPAGETGPQDANVILCPPQQGCAYPNAGLAACGVSLKLAQALLSRSRKYASNPDKVQLIVRSLLKLAAIGTIADVVSLATSENRAIVQLGLHALRHTPHSPGLQALLNVSQLSDGWVDVGSIGYNIAPRINAAGRIDDAKIVVDLLLCKDPKRARTLASRINDLNTERKGLQERLVNDALLSVPEPLPAFVTVSGEVSDGWHSGIIGIVAGRLRDHLNRSVAVISVSGDIGRGSVRSVDQVHAVNALTTAKSLLNRFGGHAAAAGFDVPSVHIEPLGKALIEFAEKEMKGKPVIPNIEVSVEALPELLTLKEIQRLEDLGPFGKDNPRPVVQLSCIRPKHAIVLKEKHIKFSLGALSCIWFNGAEHWSQLKAQSIDIIGEVGVNRYNQRSSPQFIIRDARLSASSHL